MPWLSGDVWHASLISFPLCRTTTNKRREDKKRKREEDEKAKAESKQQQDKVKAELSDTIGAATDGDAGDTQPDAKSGDTPNAKKAKTGNADKPAAVLEADVSTAALPEAAEVSCHSIVRHLVHYNVVTVFYRIALHCDNTLAYCSGNLSSHLSSW